MGNDSSIEVEVKTLDEALIMEDVNRVHLLKIDTEGSDVLVLKGATDTLRRTDVVLWECHELQKISRGGPGTSDHEAMLLLDQLGFDVFQIQSKYLLKFNQ